MTLLEREIHLQALEEALAQAATGNGRVVLIGGEAGIGKTSLVEVFTHGQPRATRVLWGACDALFTPRPLGPLYDIAQQALPDWLARLDAGDDYRAIFSAFLAELQRGPSPTIVVFEDAHWADEATIDLIKFLGRRIGRTASLLILTYRDDEVVAQHPLRTIVGDLPASAVVRLSLPPLSEAAVLALARQVNRWAQGLHAATGGNPFFVTEVLASGAEGVPTSVRDAVLARAARLSPTAREVLDLASVAPGAIEHWLIEAVLQPAPAALDECLERGILHQAEGRLAFRHELARQAIENSIAPARARSLHARALLALIEHGPERVPLARLVHHATRADDGEAVLRYAPAAARRASALGAHRQAAAHYEAALRYAGRLSAEGWAELLDAYADERDLTGEAVEAKGAQLEALHLWRELGRRDQEGRALRRLSEIGMRLNLKIETNQWASEAISVLESLPPTKELAMAYSHKSRLHMVVYQMGETVHWGSRAMELAERLGDVETLIHALTNMGIMEMWHGQHSEGQAKIVRSLQLSLARNLHHHAARAAYNLASALIAAFDYAACLNYANQGIDDCARHDFDNWRLGFLSLRAQTHLEQGRWAEAEQDCIAAQEFWGRLEMRPKAELVYLRLQVRQGTPLAPEALDAMRQVAHASVFQETAYPIAALIAEAAWLKGDLAQCRAEVEPWFVTACQLNIPREVGELAYWMWRAGALAQPPPNAAEPYATQIAGDWRAAAALWEQFGCPYEQAMALMDGDEAAQHEALASFERLGAAPAAAIVRRKLRAAGARRILRGPRPATRQNPFGLTARELEILALLAKGMSNAQIAARLSLSPRTVDHHVAAILAKLDVPSREAAAKVAAERGLLS
jgi:ATP/maltotriose-dependent transcriptional regulator MalT